MTSQRQIDEWLRNDPTCSLYIEDDDEITELPTIPFMVTNLVIRNCSKLQYIHNLPTDLKHLQIADCPLLETLPSSMPPNLSYMDIQTETCISMLPTFSDSLDYLIIDCAKLHTIELLPSSLSYLYLRNTPIRTLPELLPPNLFTLVVTHSELTHLPPLPDSLDMLEISSTCLETAASFPNSLRTIRIRNTPITSLPPLPISLYELDVGGTKISVLPALPDSLHHLYVDSTQITELPKLPPILTILSCANTNIRKLPKSLPVELRVLNVSYTRINYLRAEGFANTRIYQMQTHAYTCDRFPESIKYIHFTHPDFQILDLPPLAETTITFNYEGDNIIINPKDSTDIVQYTHLKHAERKKQMMRVKARTRQLKEELIMKTWHPSRVEDWCGVQFDSMDD
jgi:Leucine-rich repeat (LRR) protein